MSWYPTFIAIFVIAEMLLLIYGVVSSIVIMRERR